MNANEPAFPVATKGSDGHQCSEHLWQFAGLTKREHFAALAFQALLSNYQAQKDICNSDPRYEKQVDGHFNFSNVLAMNSVEFADALIAELSKEKP